MSAGAPSRAVAATVASAGAAAALYFLYQRWSHRHDPAQPDQQPALSTAAAASEPRAKQMAEPKAAAAGVRQPVWHAPSAPAAPRLSVNNSLTNSKVPFVTIDPAQKIVRWYICGPTVYDSAHLGHARAYVTFDVIRRIMSDYFGYEILYVMNITDIDDKIILRARENHLLKAYSEQVAAMPAAEGWAKAVADVRDAFAAMVASREKAVKEAEEELAKAPAKDRVDAEDRAKQAHLKLQATQREQRQAEEVAAQAAQPALQALLAAAGEALSKRLDKQLGHTVSEQRIFRDHAARYEEEFMGDMRDLGVRDPTVLTRVTEYVPQIVEFVRSIISNGLAYESNGSVYFSVRAFERTHEYAKLVPHSRGNQALADEGEGALGSAAGDKREASDFALWKASKQGEPSWDSPWGPGRPGWHIECSVMASDLLGAQMDIHAGGIDLKFPHHDNELAQSEARFGCQQWVNYFLHAGHLHIGGLKMSKSLKNFTTIRAVLKDYSARQVRLLFLLQPWDAPMNFNEDALEEAKAKERTLREFFLNAKAAMRVRAGLGAYPQTWAEDERALHAALLKAQVAVHEALCDNFDYPRAVATLLDLVGSTNKYLKAHAQTASYLVLQSVVTFVHRILAVFGVIPRDELSFAAAEGGAEAGQSREAVMAPVLDALAGFRDAVRRSAQQLAKDERKNEGSAGARTAEQLLQQCDAVRDDTLPALGVRLEDVSGGPARWKLEDPAVLERERREKQQRAQEERQRKLQARVRVVREDVVRWREAQRAPRERFGAEYAQFDAEGCPTHDAAGAELPKAASKKVKKQFEQFAKAHEEYRKRAEQNARFVEEMEEQLRGFEAELRDLDALLGGGGAAAAAAGAH